MGAEGHRGLTWRHQPHSRKRDSFPGFSSRWKVACTTIGTTLCLRETMRSHV